MTVLFQCLYLVSRPPNNEQPQTTTILLQCVDMQSHQNAPKFPDLVMVISPSTVSWNFNRVYQMIQSSRH